MSTFPVTLPLPIAVPREPLPNVIKSEPDAGIVLTRKRWTKERWKFGYKFPALDATQLSSFVSHWDAVGEWDIFDWTYNSVTWSVRFDGPPRFTDLPAGWTSVEFNLVSV